MKNISKLFVLVLLFVQADLMAQKIKYKDIFPILDAKSYDTGKPQLDAFLKNPKNADHANANLQLALYFEVKLDEYDFISDSSSLLASIDSAIIYFKKAKSLITEKELKKNDEYYQAFYRRDLRTGDFGIKISDVHLDIEKKVEAIEKLNDNAVKIYTSLRKGEASYNNSNRDFASLSGRFASEKDFYLMAGDSEINILQAMVDRKDTIEAVYEEIRDAVSRLKKKGYSPEIEFMTIKNFLSDGQGSADFYANDIKLWDYSEWADQALKKIRREVLGLKERVRTAYNEINAQAQTIRLSEQIAYEDLIDEVQPSLIERLYDYDDDPLPEILLNILIEKNKYNFITNGTLNPKIRDTEDVSYQLVIHDSLQNIVSGIQDQLNQLTEPAINRGAERYPKFIEEAYSSDFGLIKYRNRLVQQFQSASEKWSAGYTEWLERSRWAVSADIQDSIYLLSRSDSSYQTIPFAKYYTITFSEGDSSHLFVMGLEFQGAKDQGFLARVANNRTIIWKENFNLGKFKYSDYEFLVSGGFVETEEDKLTAYIYTEVEGSQNNFIILNANLSGGVNWRNELSTPNRPVDIKFNDIIKETIVYLVNEDEIGLDEENPGYIVIDRTGKVR